MNLPDVRRAEALEEALDERAMIQRRPRAQLHINGDRDVTLWARSQSTPPPLVSLDSGRFGVGVFLG